MGIDSLNADGAKPQRRAVFLDRDGVINRALERGGKPYPPTNIGEFEILDGVKEACERLRGLGFILIVATNQPDVGRGTLRKEVIEEIHAFMLKRLSIDDVEVCYHAGHGTPDCQCRKPRPGMLLEAAHKWNIDLSLSWMVGDRWRDVDCGHAAGCKTVFIDYGYAEELKEKPQFVVRSLREAAEIIVREELNARL